VARGTYAGTEVPDATRPLRLRTTRASGRVSYRSHFESHCNGPSCRSLSEVGYGHGFQFLRLLTGTPVGAPHKAQAEFFSLEGGPKVFEMDGSFDYENLPIGGGCDVDQECASRNFDFFPFGWISPYRSPRYWCADP
jgi:hypothetical protein